MIWEIDPTHKSVEFSVRHMMVAKVKGHFERVKGAIDFDEKDQAVKSVEVEIDIASLTTGEPQRDAHLRSPDFFDVERFPTLTYRSRRAERHGDKYRVTGDLTIHGITREVVLEGEFIGVATDPYGNVRAGFSAEASVNRKDFGLLWNVPLEAGGVLVGDSVKISIDAEVIRKVPAAPAKEQMA